MINVYNNTASAVTCEIMVIEVGHNWIAPTMWATYSTREAIVELVNNCSLLVGNYDDYRAYSQAIETLFDICVNNEAIASIKAIQDKADRLKNAETQLERVQASEVEMEIYSIDFENDSKTSKKYAMIQEQLPAITAELEKIIKEAKKA